jgi:hypothetical protein
VTAERFPIEAGHIMMFARSVGDANPAYYDEQAAIAAGLPGVVAPPTFVQASAQYDADYPLRPKIGEPWFGSGREPTGRARGEGGAGGGGGGGTGLHAEQHYEYFGVVGPGDVLVPKERPGETWEKQGRRGGKLIFSEMITEYFKEDGELAVRARSVGVRTERVVEKED